MTTRIRTGRECTTQKRRYGSESQALAALISVRGDRLRAGETQDFETRIYPCWACQGWHLTSQVVSRNDLVPARDRYHTEDVRAYVTRLERRIAEQRTHLLSIHALGHGGNNRQARARIASLTLALAHMTELWDKERRNREALVEQLRDAKATRRRRFWRRGGDDA